MYTIDVYGPLNGASAMAANGLLRYILSGCFPLWTVQMYEALGIGWATSLLAFVCVAMLPIPFIFFKYGPAIRRRSRYDTIKD
ncbi:Polyamine transporter 4 [Fulvia fulva]|uniref:Polyamine transporter 4 n=1 Tax=Passalora fulva TaxID=5499 RepID=A0A9Q8UUS2_PASFU|nr:Polyamine transporter 4 [Fulvia fulva]KAK4626423.1 Polyamine transporter 4 [Fulvia fulva]KAK4627862.1 Polyamine transporter 4 [Fulvia fulva]UJO23246.1 Polyamine transporter 4 [Fulvia fulva]WPV13153.1 Polyamine transporter 4 [Fulvia fulva]WPV28743.1 Polyamine transporter 4 [Fulvia fulva]